VIGCLVLCLVLGALAANASAQAGKKMAVTTTSPEARALFVQGFDLLERRRYNDAYARCREAVAKDPSFAVAHLCMYITTGSKTEALEEMRRAVSLADKVTEPERLWILSDDAIVRGDTATEKSAITRIVALLPDDERAHNLLGAYYYRRRDYAAAIDAYLKATKIAPAYTIVYNQLGYSYEFLGRYPEAEAAFRKYIELLPDDPNPYDSYAELLMKMGNYRGSIQQYEKALAIDPKFATAFIGIGNDQLFLGRFADARNTFARFLPAARTDEDRRQAWLWTALSHVYERRTTEALAAVTKASTIAEAAADLRGVAADLHLVGEILLETGRTAEAATTFGRQADLLRRTSAPDEVKAADKRDARFDRGRVALAKADLATARTERDALLREATDAKAPPSLFRAHELAGRIALADKDCNAAVAALEQADPTDPRARYLLGLAIEGKGDTAKAHKIFAEVAAWNAIHPDLAFVHKHAIAAAQRLAHGRAR
jgi:tetratricopeptide (TPR) repeat protein